MFWIGEKGLLPEKMSDFWYSATLHWPKLIQNCPAPPSQELRRDQQGLLDVCILHMSCYSEMGSMTMLIYFGPSRTILPMLVHCFLQANPRDQFSRCLKHCLSPEQCISRACRSGNCDYHGSTLRMQVTADVFDGPSLSRFWCLSLLMPSIILKTSYPKYASWSERMLEDQ